MKNNNVLFLFFTFAITVLYLDESQTEQINSTTRAKIPNPDEINEMPNKERRVKGKKNRD